MIQSVIQTARHRQAAGGWAVLLTMIAIIPFGFDSTRSQIILLSKYSTGSHYSQPYHRQTQLNSNDRHTDTP